MAHTSTGSRDRARPSPDQLQAAYRGAEILSEQLNGSKAQRRAALVEIARQVQVKEAGLAIELRPGTLGEVKHTSQGLAPLAQLPRSSYSMMHVLTLNDAFAGPGSLARGHRRQAS